MFSPVRIYFVIWIFILGLYSLKLLNYGSFSKAFYMAIGLNFVFLIFGNLLAKTFLTKGWKQEYSFENARLFLEEMKIKEKRLMLVYKVLMGLTVIGLLLIYAKVFSQISIPNFFTQQNTVKGYVERSVVGNYLAAATYIAIPLSVILVMVNKKSFLYIVFPIVGAILYASSFWGRVPIFTALITLVFGYLIVKKIKEFAEGKVKRVKVTRLLLMGVISFFVIFSFLSWTIEQRFAEFGDSYGTDRKYENRGELNYFLAENLPDEGITYRSVLSTYSYLTASLPTLDHWVEQDSEYGMGQASFPYFARMFQKIGLIQGELITGDRPLGDGLQLPTLLGYAYIDYGFIGIIVFSFLIGLIGTFLYQKNLRKPRLSYIMYLPMMYQLILLSPFINATTWTHFFIVIVGSVALNLYVMNTFSIKRRSVLSNSFDRT